MEKDHPILLYALKALGCALVTFAIARYLSNCLVNSIMSVEGGSDAGRATFGLFCYMSRSFSIPLAVLNALVFSPLVARNLEMDPNFPSAIWVNIKALGFLIIAGPFIAIALGSLPFLDWWVILFYSPILVPPLIVGSLFYSFYKVMTLSI